MATLRKQERIARWILLPVVAGLLGWGLFEFIHDDYRPPTEPTDAYDIEAKRVAHSIKLPDSVPTASYYPWWLGSERYFDFLCKHEAGEWIFKTVENVEGVFQMRPRQVATSKEFHDRFAMEDPYGYTDWEARDVATLFVGPPKRVYGYLETALPPSRAVERFRGIAVGEGNWWRYSGYVGYGADRRPMSAERSGQRISRYGFTWRGIQRPHDRESGIAGGELILIDLETMEILGVRRGFARTGNVRNAPDGVNWEFAGACPEVRRPFDGKSMGKDIDFVYWFVSRVARPVSVTAKPKGG